MCSKVSFRKLPSKAGPAFRSTFWLMRGLTRWALARICFTLCVCLLLMVQTALSCRLIAYIACIRQPCLLDCPSLHVQENYVESANVPQDQQEQYFQNTKSRLAAWDGKTEYMRMFTSEAVKKVEDASLDFVYVGEHAGPVAVHMHVCTPNRC